ncbi:MAG: ABC transporter ATP-binding protein [Candidatus Kapabacteria bacterium]|nr:ABC transporter ATP-binding protein [Ignavibacteriota bacterium]MCW5884047.1 ABC transporter ATP-binding protein [Candidatus Kapabacteria bacterium]
MISAKNITKSFQIKGEEKTVVLQDLNLEVDKGQFVALVGPSGVGKSTLLYLLGTLDKPDCGNILFQSNDWNYDITAMNDYELSKLRNKMLGFVFQFNQLLPEFTAIENVMIPAFIAGVGKKTANDKAKFLLDKVGMSHRMTHKPTELSGGEQQRIAIARALINDPEIILADEPTGNLDAANSKAVLDLLGQIMNDYKLTCIVATHSSDVASVAGRICSMGYGKIIDERYSNNLSDKF